MDIALLTAVQPLMSVPVAWYKPAVFTKIELPFALVFQR